MAADTRAVKTKVAAAVDRLADELEQLSHRIHDHPELAYQEVQAARWLSDYLAGQGFEVERGIPARSAASSIVRSLACLPK